MSDSLQPHGLLQARILGSLSLLQRVDLPEPGMQSSPALQADSLLVELPGKPISVCTFNYFMMTFPISIFSFVLHDFLFPFSGV